MTSGKMENAFWKKLQGESTMQLNPGNQANQTQNINALQNLNQMLMLSTSSSSTNGPAATTTSNNDSSQTRPNPTRDLGIVEKILNGYGFIKCLNRETRLFFHLNSLQAQTPLKIGDFVEFEESIDKRNGKPMAINVIKRQQQQDTQSDPTSMNLMNLKELLFKNASNQNLEYNQQQQSYQSLIDDLKIFKIQQQQQQTETNTASNINSLMNLFNKENLFSNQQANLFSMAKMSSSLDSKKNDLIGNEYIEGTIAIAASQSSNLDGRITYQRNGESFYIPYSSSDQLANSQLRIGDRVKFCVGQSQSLRGTSNSSNSSSSFIPGAYYACRIELIEPLSNNLINTLNNQIIIENNLQLIRQQQQFQHENMPKQFYRGVISSLKDSFGKIEREDELKETFFHFTEYKGDNPASELRVGLNVEFEIQDRYGKEIATNIKNLPDGAVCFDELSRNVFIGRIIQAPIRPSNSIGRLIYDGNNDDNLVELTFTDRDRITGASEYSFLEGDFVQFRVATDKRKNKLANFYQQQSIEKRATQLTLIEEYSLVDNSINTNEHRERGVLTKIYNSNELLNNKLKYGAIKCLEHDEVVYFCFNEIINFVKFKSDLASSALGYKINQVNVEVGDSIEFSVVQCQKDQVFKNGLKAIRVLQLAKNSVQFEIISSEVFNGVVEKEPDSVQNDSFGVIKYEYKNASFKTIMFGYQTEQGDDQARKKSVSQSQLFVAGDRVQFNILTCVRTNKQFATNLKPVEQRKQLGYVTMLKDNYGFIELNFLADAALSKSLPKLPRDIFFHYSSFQGVVGELEVGDEVEFTINRKNKNKLSAENVARITSKNSKRSNSPLPGVLKGKVIQALRSHSNNQNINGQDNTNDNYYGKIQVQSDKKELSDVVYQFGLFSLSDKKVNLQLGDIVSFQLVDFSDGSARKAFNILLVQQAQVDQSFTAEKQSDKQAVRSREFKKGKVESVKGHCGFIEYSAGNETKKVFFHVSDLAEGTGSEALNPLKPGDEVEFQVSHNSRNGKFSAIRIKKLAQVQISSEQSAADLQDAKRPERLNLKLKSANIDNESGRQLILIRGPCNPDCKSKSFSKQLKERVPGVLTNPSNLNQLVNENTSTGGSDDAKQVQTSSRSTSESNNSEN